MELRSGEEPWTRVRLSSRESMLACEEGEVEVPLMCSEKCVKHISFDVVAVVMVTCQRGLCVKRWTYPLGGEGIEES